MKLNLSFDEEGRPRIGLGDEPFILDLEPRLPKAPDPLSAGGWERKAGRDDWGEFTSWRRVYSQGAEPLLSLTLRDYGEAIWLEVELLRALSGLRTRDSFAHLSILAPAFSLAEAPEFLAVTYGLGDSDDGYPGGYWPTAILGRGAGELPRQALAPLVLYSQAGALAIAPANWFLTSALVRIPGGVARGLHGAVEGLPTGFKLATLIASGDDPFSALGALGRLLRSRGEPPGQEDHPLLTRLGWWNAYGGYYTELLRPLNAEELARVVSSLKASGIPLGYLGLDLWYPYETIGKALRYRADPKKYPEGLRALRARWDIPYVLHLSALSERNEYGARGGDPEAYRAIAQDLLAEGGIAAWHDWLRTQQHLTPELRADPEAAEAWFSGLARAFSQVGLPLLLCMHTMGMVLASTRHRNVISARSHTDFLFSLQEVLTEAARRGHEELLEAWTPPGKLRAQNLIMGAVLSAFGLAPFHDLFLTRPHPGLGGDRPWEDAVLRALSCGPVGIGDAPGMTDAQLVDKLLVAGRLAQPDAPPRPHLPSLKEDVHLYWTERRAQDLSWYYLLALNTAEEERPFKLSLPFDPGEHCAWDGYTGRPVNTLAGVLPPGGMAYFVLAPEVGGISPLGYRGKLVPAPRRGFAAERDGKGIRIWSNGTPILVQGKALSAQGGNGSPVELGRENGLWTVAPRRGQGWIRIVRR
ncbi:hypothetical protein DRJ54_05580 [Candidatus Acetothermia bacterium]|nr:MAG: hypothetical protein DRJ54_05580 [Candidatus Acetothermia bacterium]